MPRESAIFLILCLLLFACKKQETIRYPSVFNLSLSSEATTIANVLVEHDGDASVEYYLVCLREKGKDYSDAELIHLAKEDLSAGAKRLKGNKRIVSFDGLEVDSRYVAAAVLVGKNGDILNDKLAARLDFETGSSYKIHIAVTGRGKTSFEVHVESESDKPWFIFATPDFEADIQTLISKEYSSESFSGQLYTGTRTVTVEGLKPGWRYRVIAAYEPSGGHYFNYELDKERTDWDPVVADNWILEYKGMQKEEGMDIPGPVFNVQIPDGEYVALRLLMSAAFEYNSDLKYWLEEAANDTLVEEHFGDINFGPVQQTEWVLIAVGTEGLSHNLSGKYYVSEPFLADYGEALEGYKKWLGKWSVGDDNVRFNLWIEEGNINYNYIAYGWEDFADEFPIQFDPKTGQLRFLASVAEPEFVFEDGTVLDILFSGRYYDEIDQTYYSFGEVGYLGYAVLVDDNNAKLSAGTVTTDTGFQGYVSTMQFLGYPIEDNGYYYYWSEPEELPHFPMTMKRLENKANESTPSRSYCRFNALRLPGVQPKRQERR